MGYVKNSVSSLLFSIFISKSLLAGDKVMAEGLDYTNQSICSEWSLLHYTVNNTRGFYNGLVTSGSPWQAGSIYLETSVWDTDFVDIQKNIAGQDYANFDHSGYGISYFSGHGSSGDFTSPQYNCSSHSACQSLIPSGTGPGKCLWNPGSAQGTCFFNAEHLIGTCSFISSFGNGPDSVTGIMKFGESPTSGTWAGAGSDGGVNIAILDNSNTLRSPTFAWQSLGPMFAGVHMMGVVMPIGWGSDNLDNQEVGPTFAIRLRSNPSASLAEQWLLSLNDVSASIGTTCGSTGGGHGIGGATYGGGCGGRYMGAISNTYSGAYSTVVYQSTYGAQNDNNDMTGASYLIYSYICNYDCQTYPFDKG